MLLTPEIVEGHRPVGDDVITWIIIYDLFLLLLLPGKGRNSINECLCPVICQHVPCNTLTHSTNEDLLSIKRKGDPEFSYPLSYVRYHWNPEPVCNKSHFVSLFYLYWYFLNLLNLFWHTDKNFCFYAEVNFWDFVRNE